MSWLTRRWTRLGRPAPNPTTALGPAGEAVAARHLRRLGYRILLTNFRLEGKSAGEIDLIARDGQTIVFVEVKTRRSESIARPEAQVDHHKRRQIARVARQYLTKYGPTWPAYRFDIVAVVWQEGKEPEVRHTVRAFEGE